MFTSYQPARDEGFYDRRGELARLDDVVDRLAAGHPKWLALIGPRKIGKSSLLGELERRRAGSEVVFVVHDVLESGPASLDTVRALLIRVVDRALGADAGQSLEALATDPPAYRAALAGAAAFARLPPALRATLLELPAVRLDGVRLRAALEVPEQLAAALDRRLLIAIDEFQELAGLGSGRGRADLMPMLRAIWQRHRRVGYVISGSERTMLLELVTSERSPFFQHFDVLEVGGFGVADAHALLVDHGEGRIGPALAARAVELVGGHPFYLQLVGEALLALPGRLDETALKQALSDLLFTATGRLALYFVADYQRLVGRSASLAATLSALAQPRRLGELAHALGIATGAAASYIARLGDALIRDGDLYRVADPLFARWLAWRGPAGAAVPMTMLGDDAERAVAEDLARLGFDLVYQSRASRGAFDLLATRAAHQLGVQVKRAALPHSLAAAEWKRMVAESRRLGWDFLVAVVEPDGAVRYLDSDRIARGGKPRLRATDAIDNLLAWLDGRGLRARRGQ